MRRLHRSHRHSKPGRTMQCVLLWQPVSLWESAVWPAWCRFTPKWWSKHRELYLHLLASLSRHRIGAITIPTRIGRLGRSSETVSMPARSGCENIASATGAAGSIAGARRSHVGGASRPRQHSRQPSAAPRVAHPANVCQEPPRRSVKAGGAPQSPTIVQPILNSCNHTFGTRFAGPPAKYRHYDRSHLPVDSVSHHPNSGAGAPFRSTPARWQACGEPRSGRRTGPRSSPPNPGRPPPLLPRPSGARSRGRLSTSLPPR